MFYYYTKEDALIASANPCPGLTPAQPRSAVPVYFLLEDDPVLGRGSFRVTHPGQLAMPHALEVLDASRLPEFPLDETLTEALEAGRLTAVNRARPGWEALLSPRPRGGKKRVNLLALGDVGSTLLMGLKLLGGDVIDSIGIYDLDEKSVARWTFEMEQVALPWDYDALPRVEPVCREDLFRCDLFAFVASVGIPPVGSQVKDVRMAQFERNAKIVKQYARQARAEGYTGLWAAISDPVDPLAKTAYLESNRDESGAWDGRGLRPEQVQGFGLGVMNARAAYYAKRDARLGRFLTEGRAFGPHGQGLVIADSIAHYDPALSEELTRRSLEANLEMRALGFKPYAAPALSSGALSLLLTLRGAWHYGSVFLDGVYLGCKNRLTPQGIETELLPHIPDALFEALRASAAGLREIL